MLNKINNVNTILLDVCGTIINFQTADKFVLYSLSILNSKKRIQAFIYKILRMLWITEKIGFSYKYALLGLLKNNRKEKLDFIAKNYFNDLLVNNLNKNVVSFLDKYKGCRVIIVSAAYDIYVKYIAEYLGIKEYLSTELRFERNVFTGNTNGYDCIGEYKLLKLRENGILDEIYYESTAVLSDSYSDLPLFSLGKYKIAINPDKRLKTLIEAGLIYDENIIL